MIPEQAALAELVRGQRWFGSKSRALTVAELVDEGPLAPGCALALLQTGFADGQPGELYQLPYRRHGEELVLALDDPELAAALLAACREARPIATRAGQLEFSLARPLPGELSLAAVHAAGGEQSNSSVVFGEAVLLKAYRRLEPGESVELELLRFLAAHGFAQAPALLGWYGYAGASITATLGILQDFVPAARNGWELALESFADPDPFLARLRRLGEVTAALHAAFASDPDDPAFAPEELGAEELAAAGEQALREAQELLAGLEPDGPAEALRTRGDRVLERLGQVWRLEDGGRAIRQHGDFHLGQVLWAGDDWLVLDFEGEPARTHAQRRRKSSPLRDVAGLLRSLAYAAEARLTQGVVPPLAWERDARAQFMAGYLSAADRTLLPDSLDDRLRLLAACELEKAFYELRYELDNRPTWAHIPAAGILRLLDLA